MFSCEDAANVKIRHKSEIMPLLKQPLAAVRRLHACKSQLRKERGTSMKLGPITTMTSAFAAAAVGLAIGLATSAGAIPAGATPATLDAATSTSAVTATAANAPQYVLRDCDFKGVTEPSSYVLACADDGLGLAGLHWTTWTSHFAAAYGTLYANDCQPNCADGHFHNYPVIVTAWGSASVAGQPGERRYTQLTLTFPGTSRPPAYQLVNGKIVTTYPVTQVIPAN
jgi:hypothetical protein